MTQDLSKYLIENKDKLKIGLEVHTYLPTKTKLFCSCENTKNDIENINVCPICLGYPGSRPKLNKKAVEYGLKLANAFNCEISNPFYFSRKSYFYPDLTKNFQTTQKETPIGKKGFIDVYYKGKKITIRLIEIHIEEDAAQIKRSKNNTAIIDFNRAGSPLIEIVTEPDLKSIKQVEIFLETLIGFLKHNGIENPIIKSDVNVSLFSGRVEIKNVNGVNNIKESIIAELKREWELYKNKKEITLGTAHFDSENKSTHITRSKENEQEYGYIPEPDLGKFTIDEFKDISAINPNKYYLELKEITDNEDLLRHIIYNYPNLAKFLAKTKDFNFVSQKLIREIKKQKVHDLEMSEIESIYQQYKD